LTGSCKSVIIGANVVNEKVCFETAEIAQLHPPSYTDSTQLNTVPSKMSQQPMGDIFKSSETVRDYDVMIGGVTRSLAEHILQKYLESDSLEGKVVLDNACGTGVVTKVILSQADNVKIEATDISEPMVDTLKASLASNPKAYKSVNTAVMDGQVAFMSVPG